MSLRACNSSMACTYGTVQNASNCDGLTPDLNVAITQLMSNYRNKTSTSLMTGDELLHNIYNKQQTLGSRLFMEGLLVHEWKGYVSTFLPPSKCPNTWLRKLLLQMWDVTWQMWDH